MQTRAFSAAISLLATSALAMACTSTEARSVRVSAYGEPFIEEGIPASALVDGYAISFSRFSVRLEDVRVGSETSEGPHDIELTRESDGDGHDVDTLALESGTYGESGFSISRVEVRGTASKGDRTLSFEWSFRARVDYAGCETEIVVGEDGGGFEITIHADHLFYDSLVAEEPSLAFEPYAAADADGNGWITEDELREAELGTFDPGSDGDIDDLWAYLTRQVRNLGHANGEAHCEAVAR